METLSSPKGGSDLEAMAAALRGKAVEMSHAASSAHLGSSLSCSDVLAAAYWNVLNVDATQPGDPLRDRFILSKGHAASSLYAALALKGFFPMELLETYCTDGALLAEHPPANQLPGVEAATGSLGHGLPIGCGIALAAQIRSQNYRVYVLMSDGECNEGSVWEAAMFAAARELTNLCVIIDYNKWQATGRSDETLRLAPLRDKWEKFGWNAIEVDGHDVLELAYKMRDVPSSTGMPTALIAHTVKGKGVSFMEDDNNWHYRSPSAEEVILAHRELGLI